MRLTAILASASALVLMAAAQSASAQSSPPHILQQPALSHDLIAFSYGGNIWTVPRTGGKATRLTIGVGVESQPIFSPDGQTLAFTGEYDGNTDVFTIPVGGGIPHRVTYNPAADTAVAWSPDGKEILFRSARVSHSPRYTQLFAAPAAGGVAHVLPLPTAFAGAPSPDGRAIAYNPVGPAFSNNFFNYVAWGNYRGGMAGTVWITTLPGLDSVEVPHETAADFSPAWLGGKLYFLSGRKGPIGVFAYDPATKAVSEVYHNTGPDIRSLATDGQTLIFDRLGELYTLAPGGEPQLVSVDVTGDMPDVRARIKNVADEVQNVAVSPTGLRVAVEAHGEILTVPVKHGAIRDITNTPGVSEREPGWSPDGQSIAYFSDESGLYALHVASQTGAGPVRKYPLAAEAAYYFAPLWSPDSKKIAFYDNRLNTYVLDLVSGKLTRIPDQNTFGGFSASTNSMAWSPDSRWLVYPHSTANHLHVLKLFSTATGASTQLTDEMADASNPAFDRNGKYLYFLASNNAGAVQFGLDMSSDLYHPTQSIYALTLAGGTASPIAPQLDDEKSPAEAKEKAKENADSTPAGEAGEEKAETKAHPNVLTAPKGVTLTNVDLSGMSVADIRDRIVALSLPPKAYDSLQTGKPGVFYFLQSDDANPQGGSDGAELKRYVLDDRKAETLTDHVISYQITADGEKVLVSKGESKPGGAPPKPHLIIAAANAPIKDSDPVSLDNLPVRVDPPAEWRQMYHEVWRIERAYFYDPNFHGVDTVAEEKALEPYVAAIQSRSDLNYVFQEMLTGFSVGHLRGSGGAIAEPDKVPGGLLGADYEIRGGRYCISKIYSGGSWSPDVKAPLAQPGLNVHVGDCVLAVNGEPVTADEDIQKPLEGTAGHAVTLTLGAATGAGSRDITVVPTASEARLRNLDWIDSNRRLVDQLSSGKLAYVYLPDTGEGGFTAMNRYYFAQTDKQGAIVDERFNSGGQVADYIIEVLNRKIEGYWSARYGAIDHTPNAGVYGPKVMIANEWSGSGGDALPWLFKYRKLGPLVGKRTWGGLVGIGGIPVLMDGGEVTSPSVGFFSPNGQWDVENHGVEPDYPVEQDPKLVAAGHDPQLEAAVALAMKQLETEPASAPQRPAYPNYHPAK